MAVKPLGAVNPAATTWTQLYTTGASGGTTEAVVSSLSAVNLHASNPASIRIAHRVQGATLTNAHYVEYDFVLQPAGTNLNSYKFTGGIALRPGDILQVYASTADVAFIAWGEEGAAGL